MPAVCLCACKAMLASWRSRADMRSSAHARRNCLMSAFRAKPSASLGRCPDPSRDQAPYDQGGAPNLSPRRRSATTEPIPELLRLICRSPWRARIASTELRNSSYSRDRHGELPSHAIHLEDEQTVDRTQSVFENVIRKERPASGGRDGSTPFSRTRKPSQVGGFRIYRLQGCSVLRQQPLSELVETGNTQVNALGRLREILIPSHEDDFLIAEFECGGEMDRVIATQPQVFGIAAGASGKFLVDSDRSQLRVELLKVRQRLPVLLFPETTQAPGRRQSRPSLRIGKDARRCGIGASPELGRQIGAVLDDNELDQRRGVEVEDQARCSETRSETEPVPFTCADRAERVPCGIRTSPRRARASSGRSPSPLRRATGRPRRVTTISSPPSTRSRYSLRRSCSSRTPTSPSDGCSVM
jgi:hypothetical protein